MNAPPATRNPDLGTVLEGTVERVTFYNPENGFSVVRLRVRGRREPVAIVGTLPAVQPGEGLALVGRWQTDPRHGAQFRPERAEARRPSDVDSIVRYLGSGLVRQVGPVLATRIVAQFGERTLDILDGSPERVRDVPGIGRSRARAIAGAWIEHRALRGVIGFLSEHGLDTRFAPRLLAAYGPDAPNVLSANPYRLVTDVPGLGFAAADRLGRDVGARPTGAARLQAAVQAALLRATEDGHTRLSHTALAEAAAASAAVISDQIEGAITQLLASGAIAVETASGSTRDPGLTTGPHPAKLGYVSPLPEGQGALSPLSLWERAGVRATPIPLKPATSSGRLQIYEPSAAPSLPTSNSELGIGLAGLVRAEEELAREVLALTRRPGEEARRVDAWLARDAEARGLSEEQRLAVRGAATSGCFVLTGGPGVGKTTTTRALVRCFGALGSSVALAAPTGKAAKRLGEVVGLEARTLHRLLGADPRGFHHGPREPLPFDVVIVDEVSMLDTALARSLVRAIGPRGQLVLVGDADQLPSVGPCQVLRDLLESGRVPSARLETVFRQAASSRIVTNAHLIRRGLLPVGAVREPPLPGGSDFVFVPVSAGQAASVAARWAAERLPRALGVGPGEVQTLAPLTRVCQSLNSLLQAQLNPPAGQAERPHGALPLRVGDRVIQTRNNYRLGVFNGDGGTLVDLDAEWLQVDFGDGRTVAYGGADALDLDHAYCLTVHRAQGSEWPGVVVLAHSSYGPMLSRNLLYTAITRARKAVVIVGDEAGIARAVAQTRDRDRCTGLKELLAASENHGGTA